MKRLIFILPLVFLFLPLPLFAGELSIYCIDVGQGDSTLIIGPNGKRVLVDSGGTTFAANSILKLLDDLKIDSVDYTIATHYDHDHIGAFSKVISYIGPPKVAAFDRGGNRRASKASASPTFFRKYLAALGSSRRRVTTETTIDLGKGATISIFAVGNPDFDDEREVSNFTVLKSGLRLSGADTENEKSVALAISYGEFDMLLMGDMAGFLSLNDKCGSNKVDVEHLVGSLYTGFPYFRRVEIYHANHHGSQTAGNRLQFIRNINPEVVVISVGDSKQCGAGFNRFGHPGQNFLDNLYNSGVSKIYQTQTGGAKYITGQLPCVPKPDATFPRNYHQIPHDFLYSNHIVINTDGNYYKINNSFYNPSVYRAF